MYDEFYGFSGRPFQLTPDHRFFFNSPGHSRALAYLRYGLEQREGFIVITGGIGTILGVWLITAIWPALPRYRGDEPNAQSVPAD